jgi:hypothetical protein
MTAPFTLIAFHCDEVDLKDAATAEPTALGRILESTKAHRTDLYPGAYVFDTRRGWQDMHRLCEFLRTCSGSFLRLPFEGELFARVAPKVAESLKKQGVALYQYPGREVTG